MVVNHNCHFPGDMILVGLKEIHYDVVSYHKYSVILYNKFDIIYNVYEPYEVTFFINYHGDWTW